MNQLHKKRQAFRQSIRSKSIQELFARKRQQLIRQLRQQSLSYDGLQYNEQKLNLQSIEISHLFNFPQKQIFSNVKHFLSKYNQSISKRNQQLLFEQITSNKYFMNSLQKIYLLSKLINRQQFVLNQSIQSQYGWKNIIHEFLNCIINDQEESIGRDIFIESKKTLKFGGFQSEISQQKLFKKIDFYDMICFSLLKIWEIKPKYEYFLPLTKTYQRIYERVSAQFSLTLIAELTYDRSLMPNYSLIKKLLDTNIKKEHQIKFFRTLEILKNFLTYSKIQNNHQIHPRQLIFEYFNWFKYQINIILEEEIKIEPEKQTDHFFKNQNLQQISSQTRYFLVFFLFIILNKLSEINQIQRQYLGDQQILMLNQQLLNFKENHTLLKFLILEGKQSTEHQQKRNILRTLSFLIGFLENISLNKQINESESENDYRQKQLQFGAQLQEIQKTFEGTDYDWSGSFN